MIVAMSGFKGSGKDTAAKLLIDEYGFTKLAFADGVREMALAIDPLVPSPNTGEYYRLSYMVKMYGWDQIKNSIPEVRRLLQKIGTEGVRDILGDDSWIKVLDRKTTPYNKYVITDCRFANEVTYVLQNAGILLWVERENKQSDGHSSETDVAKSYADYILRNDSTVEDLHEDLRFLMYMRGVDPIG